MALISRQFMGYVESTPTSSLPLLYSSSSLRVSALGLYCEEPDISTAFPPPSNNASRHIFSPYLTTMSNNLLSRRNNCYTNGFGQVRCYNSAWNNWVRWLVLGLIILFALFIFFLFSCLSARRRRQSGYQPYRGTGWVLGRTPPGHGAAQYNQNAYPQQEQSYQPYYNNSEYHPR